MISLLDTTEEITTLGLIAARCDLMSADPTITDRERSQLLQRAIDYRQRQIVALYIAPRTEP